MINNRDLPQGWIITSLGDISDKPQYGWTTKANTEGGKVRLLRTTDITSGKVDWATVPFCTDDPEDIEKYLVKSGDILISRAGSIGASYLVLKDADDVVFASYLIRFRPKEPANPKYIYYYLKSSEYWKAIGDYKAGIAVPNVNASKLSQVPIPFAPITEQRLIVAEIEKQFSRLDEAVVTLKRVKANLMRYKAAMLKAAVEGKLTEQWRKEHPDVEPAEKLLERILTERRKKWEKTELTKMGASGKEPKDNKWKEKYKERRGPDVEDLPPIPENWTWVTLPQLGELNRGKSKHRPRNDPKLYGGPHPFIQTGDIRNAPGVIKTYAQTYSEGGLKQSRLWPKGTLCITIAANIADTAILGFDACFPDSVVGFIPVTSQVDVRFIEYFFRTAKRDIEKYAPATAQKNINLEILGNIAVPLPPAQEQKAIINQLNPLLLIAEQMEESVEINVKRGDRLRQAILRKAFSGELVPQDPRDEPASVLLEKINKGRQIREAIILEAKDEGHIHEEIGMVTIEKKLRDLTEVLKEAHGQLTPEQLLQRAGYNGDEIDSFYEALKRAVDQEKSIIEIRPNKTDVFLGVTKNAPR